MFRHKEYVDALDYPFNAGYVIYQNYFFPQTETGEYSDVPLKEFPKAFEKNFIYFVEHDLNEKERELILKSFKEKKDYNELAGELNMSPKELTAARTRVFVKLRNMSRSKYILSDVEYIPKNENKNIIEVGDITIESVIKSPDSITGGGDYRLVTVRRGRIALFTVRISAKMSSSMTNEDMYVFMDGLVKLAENLNIQ